MLCSYADHRAVARDSLSLSPLASLPKPVSKHRPTALRLHLALVKVCRTRLVCRGVSKASIAVEEAVDKPKASRKYSNDHSAGNEMASISKSGNKTSRGSTAFQNGSDPALGPSKNERLKGGSKQSNGKPEDDTASDRSSQHSNAARLQALKAADSHGDADTSFQERQNSNGAASTGTTSSTEEPGDTVRLIRGPGGVVRRADSQDDLREGRAAVGNRVTLDGSGSDKEHNGSASTRRSTVRLVKGPGGQMVDARKIAGWVTAPDGSRVVCPRCEGRAFIQLGEDGALQACPVCQAQQWDASGSAPILEPSRSQIRRSNKSRRKPLSDEHKEKIRAALAGRKRKPLDEEHKRRIAESMLRNNADYDARHSRSEGSMGVGKTCKVCGMPGHNKRTCPLVVDPQAQVKRATSTHPKPLNAPVFKGVTWSASNGQWRAQAWDGKKIQFLDHFDDPAEAARAFDVAVLEWRGEKAVTNFPAEDYFVEGVWSTDAEHSSEDSKLPTARAQPARTKSSKREPPGAARTNPAKSEAAQSFGTEPAEREGAQLDHDALMALPEAAQHAQAEPKRSPAAQPAQEQQRYPTAAFQAESDTAVQNPSGTSLNDAATEKNSNMLADQFHFSKAEESAASTATPDKDEASIGQDAAKQPDISPLIAMEQSSSDVSAADLAGRPAASLQETTIVPAAILESLSMSEAASDEAPMSASTSRRLRRADSAGAPPLVFELPMTRDDAIQGAVEGIRRAWAAGATRQKVELLLPGDVDGSGYPGGVKQQFSAVRSMVEAILLQLKQLPDFQGRLDVQWLDETDCVGAWESDNMAAVVLPTANILPQLKSMARAKGGKRLLLVVNPQWQMDGQIVSDFGFGQSRKEAESFVNSFEDVSVTQRLRIMGDDVRLFRCFPGAWQVHFIWPNGKGALLTGIEKQRPTYERLRSVLQGVPGSMASRSWLDRVNPFSRLGGGVSAKELLAAREDAERRDEMARSRAAGSAWSGSASKASTSPATAESSAAIGTPISAPGSSSKQRQNGQSGADDRFGEWDIITGKRVRDLRLEPVLQLAQWQQSLFGSRDSTSESLDEEAQERHR